jgi:hypothetical protein
MFLEHRADYRNGNIQLRANNDRCDGGCVAVAPQKRRHTVKKESNRRTAEKEWTQSIAVATRIRWHSIPEYLEPGSSI